MKKIFNSRWFFLAVGLVITQQVLVALSTYFIAYAGKAITENQSSVLHYVYFFFGSILLAYVFGSSALWVATRLGNRSWKKYYQELFSSLGANMGLSSEANKSLTNTWVCSEAFSTIETASSFFVDGISLTCNILFTLVAFQFVLGSLITGSICVALLASFLVIFFAHRPIDRLAGEIQEGKLEAFVSVQRIWDALFFGNSVTYQAARKSAEAETEQWFKRSERYKFMEQVISCIPVFVSIPLLIWAVSHEASHGTLAIGAIVAILPRTLNLFQNVHAVNMYAGQLILLKAKLRNLEYFPSRLEVQNLEKQIKQEDISILDKKNNLRYSVSEFFSKVTDKQIPVSGRYLITGRNGAGKSTLLKLVKTLLNESVLLGPGIQLGPRDLKGSTGEKQVAVMESLIAQRVRLFLLDEWDANLDTKNTEQVDKRMEELSTHSLIVEVRHRA